MRRNVTGRLMPPEPTAITDAYAVIKVISSDGWRTKPDGTFYLTVHPGQGVSGSVAGRPFRLGQAGFAAGSGDDGALWLGLGGWFCLALGLAAIGLLERLNAFQSGMRPRGMLMYPMKKNGEDTLEGMMRWGGVEPPNDNGVFPPPEGITLTSPDGKAVVNIFGSWNETGKSLEV